MGACVYVVFVCGYLCVGTCVYVVLVCGYLCVCGICVCRQGYVCRWVTCVGVWVSRLANNILGINDDYSGSYEYEAGECA